MKTPELQRLIPVDRIGAGLETVVEATEQECGQLAGRLNVPAVSALTCRFRLRLLPGGIVAAQGELHARLTRTCVLTLDDFETELTEKFSLRFVPQGQESEDFDPEAEDEVPYSAAVIDLGEAAVEQLALTLDPYPRAPGAELPSEQTQPASSPFSPLASLRVRH